MGDKNMNRKIDLKKLSKMQNREIKDRLRGMKDRVRRSNLYLIGLLGGRRTRMKERQFLKTEKFSELMKYACILQF